jgi:hypothetical protein
MIDITFEPDSGTYFRYFILMLFPFGVHKAIIIGNAMISFLISIIRYDISFALPRLLNFSFSILYGSSDKFLLLY